MAFKVVVHEAALAELEDAIEWYTKISEELSKDLIARFNTALDEIKNVPLANAEIRAGFRKQNMERFPYKIVYKIFTTEILIVAIVHHKRKPAYWSKRR